MSAVPTIAVDAQNKLAFYAVGWNYQYKYRLPDFRPTELRGAISSTSVEYNKKGMAGVEQDVIIQTDEGTINVEILSWYFWYNQWDGPIIGVLIYNEKGNVGLYKSAKAEFGEVYRYVVSINAPDYVHILIWDEEWNLVIKASYATSAQYIKETNSYLEYWQYKTPGYFRYSGWQILTGLYDPAVGWKRANECMNKNYDKESSYLDELLKVKHKVIIDQGWKLNGSYYDKGEIDDR